MLSGFVRVDPTRIVFERQEGVAHFLCNATRSSRRVSAVHLKLQGHPIYIELWEQPRDEHGDGTFSPIPRVTDVPLLVSNLQKAIRQRKSRIAAKTALELAHASIVTLARRLIIIAVEDVRPNAHIPVCCWIMVALAIKSYTARRSDVVWLVQYAQVLANDDVRIAPGKLPDASSLWRAADRRGDDVALALLIRSTFGGMQGDLAMLQYAANIDQRNVPVLDWPNDEVGRLDLDDILPEAVDFHCQPSMLECLAKSTNLDKATIKDAIWNSSSKTNTRGVPPDKHPYWGMIAVHLHPKRLQRIRRAFTSDR
tara:strand:+ start:49 stop:981 length:933 start_codon:yes stop_codon:yes gene_type:complete